MPTKIEKLDDLKRLPKGTDVLIIRSGTETVDKFCVHGEVDSVEMDVWLNIGNSVRVPTTPASSIAKYYKLPDMENASPEALLELSRKNLILTREKSVVSYRLADFSNKETNFPSPNYMVYAV